MYEKNDTKIMNIELKGSKQIENLSILTLFILKLPKKKKNLSPSSRNLSTTRNLQKHSNLLCFKKVNRLQFLKRYHYDE